jgi:hypothetical protein
MQVGADASVIGTEGQECRRRTSRMLARDSEYEAQLIPTSSIFYAVFPHKNLCYSKVLMSKVRMALGE